MSAEPSPPAASDPGTPAASDLAAPAASALGDRGRLLAVSLIALCSGAAALVYQINWQRDLMAIVGASHYATTTIVFAYFLGFAVGAWFARSWVDRLRDVFVAIIALELTIGLFAWLSPWLFTGLRWLAGSAVPPLGEPSLSVVVARSMLSTLALFLPTVCMGATLPLFYKAGIVVQRGRGSRIGLITGLNTSGAVLGRILTTFVLMGEVPRSDQLRIASLLNFTAVAVSAALMLWLRRQAPGAAPAAPPATPTAAPGRADWRILGAYALSGAAGLALEIVWNRLAYMGLQHTIYTFAITLTVYLVAYAVGSLAGALWLRRAEPTRNRVALLQLLALLTTVAGFLIFRNGIGFEDLPQPFGYFGAATLLVSIYVFLPSFFMGVAMPLVLQLVTDDLARLGRDASQAQMVNNVGSLVAVFLVGFVLIPLASLHTVSLFCLLLLAGGVLLLFEPPDLFGLPPRAVWGGAAAALAVGFLLYPSDLYRGFRADRYVGAVETLEDENGYWAVTRDATHFVLKLNGYYENSIKNPPTETLEGDFLVAAMLKPEIRDAYMVGLGFGIGAYELLRLDELERFVTAEISPASIVLARNTWQRFGGGMFADDRHEIVYEDGRIYLEHTDQQFDLIISGTNRSFYPGSTHIYSVEYWELIEDRLADGGLFFQWLPTYTKFSSATLLKTFLTVFPDALIVRYHGIFPANYLVGFKGGLPEDLERSMDRAFARAPAVFASTELPTRFHAMRAIWLPRYRKLMSDPSIPVNRDDFPVVEYSFRGHEGQGDFVQNFPLEEFGMPYSRERYERTRRRGLRQP